MTQPGIQHGLLSGVREIRGAGGDRNIIEKARCDIFRRQTERFGGTLVSGIEDLGADDAGSGSVVVDDKMEADRMCRLLKIDHPPPYVKVVKSSWLSACIKQKQLVDSVAYELDVSWLSRTRKHENKSDTESEEGKVSEEKKEVKPATLCHSYKKPKTQDIEGEDPDSDYAPSDGEGPDEVQGPSVSATSSTSPEKLIAVS
uniref:BRCT domain-containing protein n=1 Tax=Magallana gigas TaxID=29159 RepID=A0A8W8IEU7_MAGGI